MNSGIGKSFRGNRHDQPHADEERMDASGKIRTLHWNRHGDLDGFVLEDETEVKFPPHRAHDLQEVVAVGDSVDIEGRRHETPKGDIHLHADHILNRRSKKSVFRHEASLDPVAPVETSSEPTNADLMRELKAIRKLLEKKSRPRAE